MKYIKRFRKIMDLAYEINNTYHYGLMNSLIEAVKYYKKKTKRKLDES